MENPIRIRIQPEKPAGDIPLISRHDRILGHVLHLVGLGVGVRHGAIEVVFVGPFCAAGEGFIGEEGAEEIEGVRGFVDVDVEVGEGGAEEDEVAAAVVGVAVCGGEGHDMAAELTGVDWEAAEAVDEVG